MVSFVTISRNLHFRLASTGHPVGTELTTDFLASDNGHSDSTLSTPYRKSLLFPATGMESGVA